MGLTVFISIRDGAAMTAMDFCIDADCT